ncbi:MAG: hypothetical protein DHS20C19_09820 [Acidimicrobiales bacterium]|nr:MAG: hypothetical protein DHS20C19_09820 [Acidimicrobiales bacterium]
MSDTATVLARAEQLVSAGRYSDAIQLLTENLAGARDAALETRLLQIRHAAFDALREPAGPEQWPRPEPDRWPIEGLPEVHASELDAATVGAALQHHGALLVRGLLDEERAATLRATIDRAFAGAERLREDPKIDPGPDLRPFLPHDRYEFGPIERAFANFGSGVMGVDCPAAMYEMTEALDAAGVRALLTDYFGESPAFSVKKTTLRRTEPDAPPGWHQDGAFLGMASRALNIWTALTPCGVDAPGIDVFALNFDHLVRTGGPNIYDWSVSDETASRYDADRIVRPVFEAGDALLFDQMTLHRTGVDSTMTKTRYAVEMWFFAPSTYPIEQIPILY